MHVQCIVLSLSPSLPPSLSLSLSSSLSLPLPLSLSLSPAPFLAAAAAVAVAALPAGPLVREEELEGDTSLEDVPELPPEVTERVDLRLGEMGRAIRDGAPPPPSP